MMWPFKNRTLEAIDALQERMLEWNYMVSRDLQNLQHSIELHKLKIDTTLTGIARIIAKLDPIYGVPEDDPARIKASQELEGKVLAKLMAEQAALHHDPRNR